MSYKNENNGQENKFNKLNTTQNEETYNDNVISTNGAKESAEEESTEQPAHVHIPRKEKKKMKKEAALTEHSEEEKDGHQYAGNDTEVEGGYEEGEEEEDYEGEEGEYEEGEEEEEEEGKARGFFETLDSTLHNIDTKKVAKIAAAGFLLVAGARKGGLLGGLALSVATGILAKEIMSSTEEKAEVEEEQYEEEEAEVATA